MAQGKLATAQEVADRFGVKLATVLTWTRQGRIPCVRPSRRVVRFHLAEVEAALHQAVGATNSGTQEVAREC